MMMMFSWRCAQPESLAKERTRVRSSPREARYSRSSTQAALHWHNAAGAPAPGSGARSTTGRHLRRVLLRTELSSIFVLLEATPGFDHGVHAHGLDFYDGRLMEHYA